MGSTLGVIKRNRTVVHYGLSLTIAIALIMAMVLVGSTQPAPVGASPGEVDLTTENALASINGAIFESYHPADPTGSGTFDSFVRISSNEATERGYNTDYRPVEFDENKSPQFTRTFPLSNVPVVSKVVDEVRGYYREFQLDINQEKNIPDRYLSLDELEIYVTTDNLLTGYPFDGPPGGTATKVWEMDASANYWLKLDYSLAAGGGKRDLIVWIPDSLFPSGCGYGQAGCRYNVVLYSEFGGDSTWYNNDGYEEWGVEVYNPAQKTGVKFADINSNGVKDEGELGLPGWIIYVDYDGNGSLDPGEPYGLTGADGSYTILCIKPGTYWVREVQVEGWQQTCPSDPRGYLETFSFGDKKSGNNFGNYPLASVTIAKSGDELSKVGDNVTYTFTIRNTSPCTVPNLVLDNVTDSVLGDLTAEATAAGADTLTCGEQQTFQVTREVPIGADDPLINIVTVHYHPCDLADIDVTANSSHSVQLFQPAIDIVKTGARLSKIGDKVDYEITVYNNSSADTPDMVCTVTDAMLGINETFTLASGHSYSINVNDFVIPTDALDPFINTAYVTASPTGFPNIYTDNASWSTNLFKPEINLELTGDTLSKIGDNVTYTLVLHNTGSSDSPDLAGTVSIEALGWSGSFTGLASGSDIFWSITRTVPETAGDPYVVTANVTCSPIGHPNVYTDSACWSTNLFQPAIEITKTGDELSKIGDNVTYTIRVTNNSSADTPDMACSVSDPAIGFTGSATLSSGAWAEWVIPFTIPADTADPFINTATVTASPKGFPNVYTDNASWSTNLFQPGIDLEITGDELSKIGDNVTYTLVLHNTCSSDTPDLAGTVIIGALGWSNNFTGLASGDNITWSIPWTIPDTDSDPYEVTANVTCSPDGFPNVYTDATSWSTNLFQPDFTITKTAFPIVVEVGDTITYTYIITNTSSEDSPDLVLQGVSDNVFGSLWDRAVAAGADTLSKNESVSFTYTYIARSSDAPSLVNTVTAVYQVDGFSNKITREASAEVSVSEPPEKPPVPGVSLWGTIIATLAVASLAVYMLNRRASSIGKN